MSSYNEYLMELKKMRPININSQANFLAALTIMQDIVTKSLSQTVATENAEAMEESIINEIRKTGFQRYKTLTEYIRFTFNTGSRTAATAVNALVEKKKIHKIHDFYVCADVTPEILLKPVTDFMQEHPRAVSASLTALLTNTYKTSDYEGKTLLNWMVANNMLRQNYDKTYSTRENH